MNQQVIEELTQLVAEGKKLAVVSYVNELLKEMCFQAMEEGAAQGYALGYKEGQADVYESVAGQDD